MVVLRERVANLGACALESARGSNVRPELLRGQLFNRLLQRVVAELHAIRWRNSLKGAAVRLSVFLLLSCCFSVLLSSLSIHRYALNSIHHIKPLSFCRYLAMVAQALVVKSDISARRARNSFGTVTWQHNEIWPTGGWGSVCLLLYFPLAVGLSCHRTRAFRRHFA